VTFSSSSKTRHASCCPLRRRSSSQPWSDRGPTLACTSHDAGLNSSLGVVQRSPLRRHMLRASTPVRVPPCPKTPLSTHFDREMPLPDSFRPCRSSRLRRFSPLWHCRLVASCSRPWGSPRFGPAPSTLGHSWRSLLDRSSRSVPACRSGRWHPPVSSRLVPKFLPFGAARRTDLPRGVFTLRRFSLVRSRDLWTTVP